MAGPGFQTQRLANCHLQRKIASGEDVGMSGAEQQVNLCCPWPDAVDCRELPDRLTGRQGACPVEIESIISDGRGQGHKRSLLRSRKTRFDEGGQAGLQQSVRRQGFDEPAKPPADRLGARARDLLGDDDGAKAGETGWKPPQWDRSCTHDHWSQAWIELSKLSKTVFDICDGLDRLHVRPGLPICVGQRSNRGSKQAVYSHVRDVRMSSPVFRFAPSPNGELHLGHAFSALTNYRLAQETGGRFLLRIEDIDIGRCRREYEDAILQDLEWLGIEWEQPVRRQSDHFEDYAEALDRLIDEGLAYPAFMSRGDIRAFIASTEDSGISWPRDPDGVAHYPGVERTLNTLERRERISAGDPYSWRLDMAATQLRVGSGLAWREEGSGPEGETGMIEANPAEWGDVIIARRDVPTSYHLAVVVDDAIQGITHVVRGRDLFHATSVQRLLQELLGLSAPVYCHHDLVLGEDGRKLSKSRRDTSIAALREAGAQPADIARMVGLDPLTSG